MIDFGQPQQPPEPRSNRRGLVVAAVVAALVLVLVVALINGRRTRGSDAAGPSVPTATAPPTQPSLPGSSGSNGSSNGGTGGTGSGGTAVPRVACPTIRDEQSHLTYRCIDNYLVQDDTDTGLGLRIALNHEVETGWVITEGSGNPASIDPGGTVVGDRGTTLPVRPVALHAAAGATAADVQAEVKRRTETALVTGYGDTPTSTTLAQHTRSFGGVAGYELVTEITVNPAFRAAEGLQVKTERLWVVGVPTSAGVSIFMMSIPDSRADLWPKAEATVGTVHVI